MRERHARRPVVHGVQQRAEKYFLLVAKLFDLRRLFGESLDNAHAGDVFLNDSGHRAVEVVHFAPLRLQFARKQGDERDGGNQGQQRHRAQRRARRKDEDGRRQESDDDVEAQEEAGEQKILETPDVGGRTGDQFAGI